MCRVESLEESLMIAAGSGNLDLLTTLLRRDDFKEISLMSTGRHPDWTRYTRYRWPTPLSLAAEKGHAHILEAIVKFYVEASNSEAGYPLEAACWEGNTDCVRILIKYMPHLQGIVCRRISRPKRGLLPIHIAALQGHSKIAGVLMKAYAKDNRNTCGLIATNSEGEAKSLEMFLRNDGGSYKSSPLAIAATYGHLETLKVLSNCFPLDSKYGAHALYCAAASFNNNCAQYLLENGASFNVNDKDSILYVWRRIINLQCDLFAKPIQTIKILLENGVSMKPIATEIHLLPMLRCIRKPILQFLLSSGLLESVFLITRQLLDSKSCTRFAEDMYDYIWKHCYSDQHERLRIIFQHLPYSFDPAQRNLYRDFEGTGVFDKSRKNALSLQELCRWKIRSCIVWKQGYISYKHASKLHLPIVLQNYLLYQ